MGSVYPPPAYPPLGVGAMVGTQPLGVGAMVGTQPLGVGAMVGTQPLDASSITTLPAIGGAESFPTSGSAASGTWE